MTLGNVLAAIGKTPLVRLNHMHDNPEVEIFAKLEKVNPGGSIKDRIVSYMLDKAEKSGQLKKHHTLIEASSGNTGIGLAMVSAVKGYQCLIVMSEAVSMERRQMIRAFGAEIVLTSAEEGTDGAIRKTRELLAKEAEKYFALNQFCNTDNAMTHYYSTGPEIWEDMGGQIDYFVSAIGTSGTIMGVGKYLKERDPNIKIVCAHPERNHYIQGLKNMQDAIVPEIYDESKIDEFINIPSEEAFEFARQITRQEGILSGMSSGAAMMASLEIAKKIKKGRIVTIFPDGGEKYLSTKLYNI